MADEIINSSLVSLKTLARVSFKHNVMDFLTLEGSRGLLLKSSGVRESKIYKTLLGLYTKLVCSFCR